MTDRRYWPPVPGRTRSFLAPLVVGLGGWVLDLFLSVPGMAYLEGPPVATTGGFGEQTCLECHFDGPLNDPAGSLALAGIPERYVPGTEYQIDIRLSRSDLRRAGFQLAARFADGREAGRQAGTLEVLDQRVDIIKSEATSIQYAQQNEAGSLASRVDAINWTIRWRAPALAPGPVAFSVAANASNDDRSELGDWIYTDEVQISAP